MMTLVLASMKEDEKPGYWSRNSQTINTVYFIFYVIAAGLFLGYVHFCWFYAED